MRSYLLTLRNGVILQSAQGLGSAYMALRTLSIQKTGGVEGLETSLDCFEDYERP